jgi:protein gp37
MGENSKIEWTDHTFNPWVGCTKIGPGCDHCYAESWAKRTGSSALWMGSRRRTSADNWRKPLKWHREAGALGVRRRVFCASLADVFDNAVEPSWRADLWELIEATPCLDWLLLTKRIGNARDMLPLRWWNGLPGHVWLGATVVNQQEAERDLHKLLAVPARVRFLSMEPLLGPVDLRPQPDHFMHGVDWVIVGGESGGHAREMAPDWARSLRDQCKHASVSFFMKQMTRKEAIPADLLVREFPTGRE